MREEPRRKTQSKPQAQAQQTRMSRGRTNTLEYNHNLENAAYNVIHTRLESLQVDVSWDIYKYLHTYFILFDTISRISYYVY